MGSWLCPQYSVFNNIKISHGWWKWGLVGLYQIWCCTALAGVRLDIVMKDNKQYLIDRYMSNETQHYIARVFAMHQTRDIKSPLLTYCYWYIYTIRRLPKKWKNFTYVYCLNTFETLIGTLWVKFTSRDLHLFNITVCRPIQTNIQ